MAPATAAGDKKIQQSEQELERVRGRIQSLASGLTKDRGEQGQLQQQLEQSENTLAEAAAKLAALKAEVQRQAAKVKATQAERAAAQAALESQREALARQLRSAYIVGQQGQTQVMLNQDDTQQLSRVLTYYDYFNRARADRITQIQQQAAALEVLEQRLQQELASLDGLRVQQQQALKTLEGARLQRKTSLASLNQRITGSVDEIAQLRNSEKEIQKLLESLRQVPVEIPMDLGGDSKPFPKLRGKLPWPARGKLLASYGDQKAGGPLSWNGIWISAAEGSPVRAVARGRVAYAGWLQRYGLMIIIEHGGGYFTLYGHNESLAKSAGEWVTPGQVIAAAGSSGGHEQSGVYFEIRKGSDPTDPAAWLGK